MSKSPLMSNYFRLGMLDGFRALPERPATDPLFTDARQHMLAFDEYRAGYLSGLDCRPMPTYEIKPNLGRTGGECRVMLNIISSR